MMTVQVIARNNDFSLKDKDTFFGGCPNGLLLDNLSGAKKVVRPQFADAHSSDHFFMVRRIISNLTTKQ